MIPIYRAKRIDNDEWVDGDFLRGIDDNNNIVTGFISNWDEEVNNWQEIRIDQNTLAIHFPNMIDKNGKKIFASLSEDGVGGDEVYVAGKGNCVVTFDHDGAFCTILNNTTIIDDLFHLSDGLAEDDVEYIIGIHKGES